MENTISFIVFNSFYACLFTYILPFSNMIAPCFIICVIFTSQIVLFCLLLLCCAFHRRNLDAQVFCVKWCGTCRRTWFKRIAMNSFRMNITALKYSQCFIPPCRECKHVFSTRYNRVWWPSVFIITFWATLTNTNDFINAPAYNMVWLVPDYTTGDYDLPVCHEAQHE